MLFIDEIHAMPKQVAELLYEAMDRGGVSAKRHGVPPQLVPFTLIGATTEPGTMPDAFLSRFENHEYLRFYEPAELAKLINGAAYSHGLWIDRLAAWRLATVARQTPRRALALLKHARKRAVTAGVGLIDSGMAAATLDALEIEGDKGDRPLSRLPGKGSVPIILRRQSGRYDLPHAAA